MVRENVSYPPGGVFTVTALDNSKLVAACGSCNEFTTNEEPVLPVEYHGRVAHLVCARYFKDKVSAENVAKPTHRLAHADAEGKPPISSVVSNELTSLLSEAPNGRKTVGRKNLRWESPTKTELDHSCFSLVARH